jgi:excisionase family DNA binding protein
MDVAGKFGDNLARCRRVAGMSQDELSIRDSVHRTEISQLERGLRLARVDTIAKLCGSLEADPGVCSWGSTGSQETLDEADSKSQQKSASQMHKKGIEQSRQRHRARCLHPSQRSRPGGSISPSPGTHPDSRHTTNPPDSCLGRSFLITNLSKGPREADAVLAAPPGGRFWHGFAVRRPPVGRGGRAMSFGRTSAEGRAAKSHPMQTPLNSDIEGMKRKSISIAFFTERSLADYLAVSDRTIRNWIRRGELPSYKLGAARRIDPADVEDFLARHREEAA